MSVPRTLAAVSATAGTPTPIYTGTVLNAISFIITNGMATITCASLPSIGYNAGQQVTLWGFATATYFNGTVVTVVRNNPTLFQFSFASTHVNVNSTADAGQTAPAPVDKQRSVHIEADQGNTTHKIYVGDGNVSASRYTACLTLVSQIAVEFSGDNIDASRIFIDTDNSSNSKVQVTLVQ